MGDTTRLFNLHLIAMDHWTYVRVTLGMAAVALLILAASNPHARPVLENFAHGQDAAGELLELRVTFELARPTRGQYRRPYVAVWLENADEDPVRTALLFMTTKEPGPKWHRDLLRWYRQDNVRRLKSDIDLIDAISAATRGPGEYQAVFDGQDDAGKPLKPGKYMLLIEVAREGGTYQIIRQPLELGSEPIKKTDLKPNVEIKSASFEYRKPGPTKSANQSTGQK